MILVQSYEHGIQVKDNYDNVHTTFCCMILICLIYHHPPQLQQFLFQLILAPMLGQH